MKLNEHIQRIQREKSTRNIHRHQLFIFFAFDIITSSSESNNII